VRGGGALPLKTSPSVRALLGIPLLRRPALVGSGARRDAAGDLRRSFDRRRSGEIPRAAGGARGPVSGWFTGSRTSRLLEIRNRTAHAAAVSALVEGERPIVLFRGVRAPGRPLDAHLHGPHRPFRGGSSISSLLRSIPKDVGSPLQHRLRSRRRSAEPTTRASMAAGHSNPQEDSHGNEAHGSAGARAGLRRAGLASRAAPRSGNHPHRLPTKTYFPTILAIVAKEKGLFEKEGSRPEITIYRGGGRPSRHRGELGGPGHGRGAPRGDVPEARRAREDRRGKR
jgi:hypothetical protein